MIYDAILINFFISKTVRLYYLFPTMTRSCLVKLPMNLSFILRIIKNWRRSLSAEWIFFLCSQNIKGCEERASKEKDVLNVEVRRLEK